MKMTAARIRNLLCAMLLLFCGRVNAQTNCVSQPSGLVNWWKGDGNAKDSIGSRDGTVTGSVSYSSGEVNNAFAFINGSVNFGTNAANFGTSSFTVELWLKTTAQVSENYEIAVMERWLASVTPWLVLGLWAWVSGQGGKSRVNPCSSSGGQDAQSLLRHTGYSTTGFGVAFGADASQRVDFIVFGRRVG